MIDSGASLEGIDLECVRGQRSLFRNLSFRVVAGEMLWVQGRNGSGKTSLLRLLCGLLRPEAGTVRWKGDDVRATREQYHADLLYAGHAPAVKDDLSGAENLHFGMAQAGLAVAHDAIDAALGTSGLRGRESLPARVLSQGQRRRVALARLTLSAQKTLWILDEPFTALDSEAVQLVQSQMTAHVRRGGAVVFTSHQTVEVAGISMKRLQLGA